jgi:hypothetical protein
MSDFTRILNAFKQVYSKTENKQILLISEKLHRLVAAVVLQQRVQEFGLLRKGQ